MNPSLPPAIAALQAPVARLAPSARAQPKGRSITDVKAHNLRTVLLTLLQRGPVPRVDLARLTGLSSTTITNLVAELQEEGIVVEAGKDAPLADHKALGRTVAGRPPRYLQLVPAARCAAGIHLGVDTIHVGVVDLFGTLQSYLIARHEDGLSPEQTLDRAAEMVQQAMTAAGATAPAGRSGCLVGIGVGASGLTDPDSGINILAPNLAWRDVPVRRILAERLGYPVTVDNNVRAMALAEAMFGAGRGIHSLIFVYGRVGVGAGFVVDGQLYHGSQAGAGEIGHTTMIPAGGAPCRCGNTGCLETLVSEAEIVRQAQILAARYPTSLLATYLARAPEEDSQPGKAPIDSIFAAARAGDREAQALLNERAFYVGTALANLVNTVNPDMIILGGLFANGDGWMLPAITETMRRRSFAGLGEKTVLCATTFGHKVGVIGAAALALDAFFYQQPGGESRPEST